MNREVWIVFDEGRRVETRATREVLRRACAGREWPVVERPLRPTRVTADGRIKRLLPGEHAWELYRRMHRAAVAVLSLDGDVQVPTDPEADTTRDRTLLSLRRYALYKSFYVNLAGCTGDLVAWIGEFDSWCDCVACEGEHDPRCLPLHVFKGHHEDQDLACEAGRAAFNRQHGGGASRVDGVGRTWSMNPHAYHGHPRLHVAGRLLRAGMHWDVRPPRRGPVRVVTPKEVWEVWRYINIYPDAAIRAARRYARLVYPRSRR